MAAFLEFHNRILHDIISVAIDSARFKGWPLSLRLVNHLFNEAVIHVYYLQKRLVAATEFHSLDCVRPCRQRFCRSHVSCRQREMYAARFNIQGLLAIRDVPKDAAHAHQLLQQWEVALTTLRGAEKLEQLESDQIRFFSTRCDNFIFNDASSAILSEAVRSYLGLAFTTKLVQGEWAISYHNHYQAHPPEFWVALSACVLGNLQLFETYINKLELSVENHSPFSPSDLLIIKAQPIILLKVAIEHAKLVIVRRLLDRYPNIMSEYSDFEPLQAAIFSKDNTVLKAVLNYTPNLPRLLHRALHCYHDMLPRSSSGSDTIRLLTQHFTPLSGESRARLILHSCAVGDTTLLREFSKTESLFSDRIDGLGSRIPTYVHFAIRCGNIDSMRFLLDHGGLEHLACARAGIQALFFNQIGCYRELYQRLEPPRSIWCFEYLALAENAERIIVEVIDENRNLLSQPVGTLDNPKPTIVQRALWNAIQKLRPRNVRCLLSTGVCLYPWPLSEYPFEIDWPYFNQNRDAFVRTQEVLDNFELPKLRVIL